MKWHYKSNNKYFTNKFAAIDEFENTRNNLLLEVPDSYTNYDFTIEPKEDISDLLKMRHLLSGSKIITSGYFTLVVLTAKQC